jgi:hypothetical protein
MSCVVCGASVDRGSPHCAICGLATDPDSAKKWDRTPEASAYEDLGASLKEDETLLAVTRGRIGGTWRRKLTFNLQSVLSPFVNVGLTSDRLILQQLQQGNGRALTDTTSDVPLSDVVSIAASEPDVLAPGNPARLAVTLSTGEAFRIRTAGRLAEAASELSEVWSTLSAAQSSAVEIRCSHCGRAWERSHRFCPFCGKEAEAVLEEGAV